MIVIVGTINSELQKVDEIVVHIGSNEISNRMKKERTVDNIDKACRKFMDVTSNIEVSVSSKFLQKYDTPTNLEIVETNAALQRHYLSNGWDLINHSNIAFKHIEKYGMHLTTEGNNIFSKKLSTRAIRE